MQKNYIQFLMLALIATGMVLIAGIRNDVNLLESQVALTGRALVNKVETEPVSTDGRALVNKTETGGNASAKTMNSVPGKMFSISEIENTIKKLGWAKQTDNSYSSGGGSLERHYLCPNCQVGGGCCVQNGIGSWSNSGSEGCGSYGTVVYGGLCSVSRVAGGSGASSQRTASVSSSSGVQILSVTLKKGMVNNADVVKLQKMLVSLGFLSAEPSGNFLFKTEIAVKLFQSANGISPVSGIVGPITRAKLNSMCTISSDGSAVSCSQ